MMYRENEKLRKQNKTAISETQEERTTLGEGGEKIEKEEQVKRGRQKVPERHYNKVSGRQGSGPQCQL